MLRKSLYKNYIQTLLLHRRNSSFISESRKVIKDRKSNNNSGNNDKVLKQQNTLDIIASNKSKYFDPENTSLDLNLPNNKLVNQIINETQFRMHLRYNKASDLWTKKFNQLCNNNSKQTEQEFKQCFDNASISAAKSIDPVSLGDLVILTEGSCEFFIVVSCPTSLDSTSYTYINNEGKIIFGPKSLIKLRIPSIFPRHFEPILQHLIMLEEKTLNIAPVGVVDDSFSRSPMSKPASLRNVNGKDGNTSKSTEPVGDQEDDFMISQASAQLLTNTDVNTYIVPEAARKLYSQPLTELSINSFKQFKSLRAKLEILHRSLQFNSNNDLLDSTKTISIFQLLHYLKQLNIPKNFHDLKGQAWVQLRREIMRYTSKDSVNDAELGKQLGVETSASYDLPTYIGLLLTLRKQGRLWKVNQQNLSYPPTSVNVLPINNSKAIDELISYIKHNKGEQKLATYIIQKLEGKTETKPEYYDELIRFFKDYIVGNLTNDLELEAVLISMIRNVSPSLQPQVTDYCYDYGRAKCFDLLQQLGELNNYYENPTHWSNALQFNTWNNELSNQYYDMLNHLWQTNDHRNDIEKLPDLNNDDFHNQEISGNIQFGINDLFEQDPLQDLRQEFNDPIFCIDAETAHEIDDGISIKEVGDQYRISIHIANPSSYIKPESNLSKIALHRGFTTYLPEGPIMMLPQFVSEVSGLGSDQKTRTFAIEFQIPKHYLDNNHSIDMTKLHHNIETTGEFKFYYANNFPKGYTYNHVEQVLNGEVQDQYKPELEKLYHLAKTLKSGRINQENGIEINRPTTSIDVKAGDVTVEEFRITESGYQLTTNGMTITISRQQDNGKSNTLVSELMIIGNYLTSIISEQLKIPIIHRTQVMNISKDIIKAIHDINNSAPSIREKEFDKIVGILNSAKYHETPAKGHESMGLKAYSQITSPLRRYNDLINQWRIQAYFINKKASMTITKLDIDLNGAINHLQARELINKRISRFSNMFWEGVFLKQYNQIKHQVEQRINFEISVLKNLKLNKFKAQIEDFNNMNSIIEFETETEDKSDMNSSSIKGNIEITTVDFIDNELVFRYLK